MNTYPKDFKNQVYIVAYGIEGLSDHVDSDVYDAHEAFEIDKTKMKMLVPLDMNGKQLMNVNYGAFDIEQNRMKMDLDMSWKELMNVDLKFGFMFTVINCGTRYGNDRRSFILVRKNNHAIFSNPSNLILCSITFHNKNAFDNKARMEIHGSSSNIIYNIKLADSVIDCGTVRILTTYLVLNSGFTRISLHDLTNNLRFSFDVDLTFSYL